MKSIIMSDESVNAIIAGRKWQTRRVVESAKPRYQVGDVLYVKEVWACVHGVGDKPDKDDIVHYRADKSEAGEVITRVKTWCSPVFMPQAYSRLHIEITGVRCEHVQDISEQDATNEGWPASDAARHTALMLKSSACGLQAIEWYIQEWDRINAKRGYPWASNPWVWVYEFKVAEVRG